MKPNKFFSSRPRGCPPASENDVILLKMCMLQQLEKGAALSYKSRLYMFIADYEDEVAIRILRPAYPDVSTDMRPESLAKAVDYFVDQFIYESDLDLDQVSFHEAVDITSPAIPWSVVRRGKSIQSLL